MGGTLHRRPVLAAAARVRPTRTPASPAVLRSRSARLHLAPAAEPIPAPVDVDPATVLAAADPEPRRLLGEEELDCVPDDRPRRPVERRVELRPAGAQTAPGRTRLEREVCEALVQERAEAIGGGRHTATRHRRDDGAVEGSPEP